MSDKINPSDIPVVILCGGRGSRLNSETHSTPKPMIMVGDEPILLHVMKSYSNFGFRRFILALGYKSEMVKRYFLEYDLLTRDFTIHLGDGKPEFHGEPRMADWKITCAETGLDTMTGARIKKVSQYIDSPHFMVTYSDGLSDIDIGKLLEFHLAHGKIGTVTGVRSASQFGELQLDGSQVKAFAEKPKVNNRINGGFFVFKREFLDFIDPSESCILETGPLVKLTAAGQLSMYPHDGFWQCMDTHKDWLMLNDLCSGGNPPWKK